MKRYTNTYHVVDQDNHGIRGCENMTGTEKEIMLDVCHYLDLDCFPDTWKIINNNNNKEL